MNKFTKLILLIITFYTPMLIAQDAKHGIYEQMIIEDINVKTKKVTIKGVEYSYEMIDEENAYYVSEGKTRNLKYLPKNRKYYVNIEYPTASDFVKRNEAGVVIYIGLIKQPF